MTCDIHQLIREHDEFKAAVEESHRRLDDAGVPKAGACEDDNCETKLGHRVRDLVRERDRLRAALASADQAISVWKSTVEIYKKGLARW